MNYKEIKQISLSKLKVSPFNVRKIGMLTEEEYNKTIGQDTRGSQDYHILKPSILETGGVIQALTVVEHNGIYEIAQGQRRYLAFKELYEEGKLTSDLVWCIVKVPINPKNEEAEIATEELINEKTRADLGDNFRDAYQIILNHYKDIEIVGRILGMDDQEAMRTYTHNQVLNAPLNLSTENGKNKEQSVFTDNSEVQVKTTRTLSHDEMQYFLRWQRENPNLAETDIEAKVQHWFKETQILNPRVKTVLIHALADYAKNENISTQTALERFLYSELKQFLIEKRFYSEQVEE